MGPSWESKSIKNRSQNEVNLGRHLGTDFSSILVGFGSQVGRENRAKIEEKLHRKYDAKPEPFRTRLGSVLGRFWPPKWSPKAPKKKKVFTFEPPGPYFEPTSVQDGPKTSFWMLLAQFLDAFGKILVRFWIRFWPNNAKKCKKKQKYVVRPSSTSRPKNVRGRRCIAGRRLR